MTQYCRKFRIDFFFVVLMFGDIKYFEYIDVGNMYVCNTDSIAKKWQHSTFNTWINLNLENQ